MADKSYEEVAKELEDSLTRQAKAADMLASALQAGANMELSVTCAIHYLLGSSASELMDAVTALAHKIGGTSPASEEAPAGGLYLVRLRNHGPRKIMCIKVIKEVTGLGLKEAKELSEKPISHAIVYTGYGLDFCNSVADRLNDVGALATVEPVPQPGEIK